MANSRLNALFLGIGAAGILVASGCHMVMGSEHEGWWYCDDSGCYECFPEGCRGLPSGHLCGGEPCSGDGPAPRPDTTCGEDTPCQNPDPSCAVSADCRAGYVCIKGGCVPGKVGPCEDDASCGAGACCVDGACQDTGLCSQDSDCSEHGAGYTCDDRGSCVAPDADGTTPPPVAKTCDGGDPDGCDGGFCVDGTCAQCSSAAGSGGDCGAASTCQLDRHCGEGRRCLDGQCTASCADSGESCGSGQVCSAGVCVADETLFCTASAECGEGSACVNNACHAVCTDTGACADPSDVCSQPIEPEAGAAVRVCQPDRQAQLECKLTKDCTGGEVCANGVCRTVCDGAEDCAVCDDGPVCGPGGFCMTAAEAQPECTLNSDCEGDAVCLGAKCTVL